MSSGSENQVEVDFLKLSNIIWTKAKDNRKSGVSGGYMSEMDGNTYSENGASLSVSVSLTSKASLLLSENQHEQNQDRSTSESHPLHLDSNVFLESRSQSGVCSGVLTAVWANDGQSEAITVPLKQEIQKESQRKKVKVKSELSVPGLANTDSSSSSKSFRRLQEQGTFKDECISPHLPKVFDLRVDFILRENNCFVSRTTIGFVTLVVFVDDLTLGPKELDLPLRKCTDFVDFHYKHHCSYPGTQDDFQDDFQDGFQNGFQNGFQDTTYAKQLQRLRVRLGENAKLSVRLSKTNTNVKASSPTELDATNNSPNLSTFTSKHDDHDRIESIASLESTYAHLNVYDDEYFDYYNHNGLSHSNNREGISNQVHTKEQQKQQPMEQQDQKNINKSLHRGEAEFKSNPNNYHHASEFGCKFLAGVGDVVRYLMHAAAQCDEEFQPHPNAYVDDGCSTIATDDFTQFSFKEEDKIRVEFGPM